MVLLLWQRFFFFFFLIDFLWNDKSITVASPYLSLDHTIFQSNLSQDCDEAKLREPIYPNLKISDTCLLCPGIQTMYFRTQKEAVEEGSLRHLKIKKYRPRITTEKSQVCFFKNFFSVFEFFRIYWNYIFRFFSTMVKKRNCL